MTWLASVATHWLENEIVMFPAVRTPLLGAMFVLVWSSGWIGSKYALNYASALGLLAWRYMLVVAALLVLVTLFRHWRKISRRELQFQASVGLLSHTAYLAFCMAAIEAGVSSGTVAFITAMQPVLTLALAYPVLQERINAQQLLGIVLGVFSVTIVIGEKISLGGSILVYGLPLLSVLSLTIASIMCRINERASRHYSQSKTPLLLLLLIQSGAAAVGFNLLAWYFGDFAMRLESGLFYVMTYLIFAVSIGSYALYFLLLKRLSAIKVASYIYLTPPVTMILGWVFFREALKLSDFFGLILALGAVVLVTRKESLLEQPSDNSTGKGHGVNYEIGKNSAKIKRESM